MVSVADFSARTRPTRVLQLLLPLLTARTQLHGGSRALIPKNAFGWPILAAGVYPDRVGEPPPHPAALAG